MPGWYQMLCLKQTAGHIDVTGHRPAQSLDNRDPHSHTNENTAFRGGLPVNYSDYDNKYVLCRHSEIDGMCISVAPVALWDMFQLLQAIFNLFHGLVRKLYKYFCIPFCVK